jgi:hypothetical protein
MNGNIKCLWTQALTVAADEVARTKIKRRDAPPLARSTKAKVKQYRPFLFSRSSGGAQTATTPALQAGLACKLSLRFLAAG